MIHKPEKSIYLTDAQFLILMGIVSDDKPIELFMPNGPGWSTTLIRNGKEYVIGPDGSYTWKMHPTSRMPQ